MNFIYRIYFLFPNFAPFGTFGKGVNFTMRKALKFIFDFFVPNYLNKTQKSQSFALNSIERKERFIVSLTSFPARISQIWITIETILRQSFKPDEIILWLDEEQFKGIELPETLVRLKSRGLTIRFCNDLRSHTKYYYAIQQFPNDTIITLDDDCYYPNNILSKLIDLHNKYPNAICSNRVHKIVLDNNNIRPYKKWKHNYKGILTPSHVLVQTGVSGVLYPPNSLNKDVLLLDIFKEKCRYADDLWLKVHSFRNNTKIVTGTDFNKDLINVSSSQLEKLVTKNVFDGGNDKQFQDVCNHFSITPSQFID